jgi:hypothetical protein
MPALKMVPAFIHCDICNAITFAGDGLLSEINKTQTQ